MAKHRNTSTKASKQHTEPRSFWSGTISFGLVTVPVNLYPAARRNRVALRMLSPDGNPLARRYFCPADDQEVDRDHLIRGYEISEDRYVVVDDETLAALAPRKSREIDLMSFVPLEQVPPMYYDRSYYLTPSGDTNKGYRLLAEVMEASGRAGIATFVMRGKEYLVAIHAENGILRAETLRFQEELRELEEQDLPPASLASKKDVETLRKLVQQYTREELPEHALEDRASNRLRELAEAKLRAGKDVVEAPEAAEDVQDADAEEDEGGVDLLETIRRNLRAGSDKPSERKEKPSAPKDGLTDLTRQELYDRAQRRGIEGRSKMTKQQLVRALRSA
jgi:DNA end-binding protein Ku